MRVNKMINGLKKRCDVNVLIGNRIMITHHNITALHISADDNTAIPATQTILFLFLFSAILPPKQL